MCKIIAQRRSDGKLFEPSHPDSWTDGHALAAAISRPGWYYFREIVATQPAPAWWQRLLGIVPPMQWKRTGAIWEFDDDAGKLFDAIHA